MDVLFTFLVDILQSAFFCWRVIQPGDMGVRTFCGKNPVALFPGLHFMCPVVGQIMTVPVKEQVLDIRSQSVTTKDGRSLAIGFSVAYEVLDPIRAVYEVRIWDESLRVEILGIAGEYVLTKTFDELRQDEAMARLIMEDLRKVATVRWGLKILRVRRSDIAACRSIRLMREPDPTRIEVEE